MQSRIPYVPPHIPQGGNPHLHRRLQPQILHHGTRAKDQYMEALQQKMRGTRQPMRQPLHMWHQRQHEPSKQGRRLRGDWDLTVHGH